MLTRLTTQWRRRAAILLAAAYALCAVMPAAALAYNNNTAAVHCLTDSHAMAHVHHNGSPAEHDHSVPGNDGAGTGQCCGLFCVSALAPTFDIATGRLPQPLGRTAAADHGLFGQDPDRIDRPPRSLLSL